MRSRSLASIAALLAAGALMACQGGLPTSATSAASPRASETAYGQPVTVGTIRYQQTEDQCGITVNEDIVQSGASFVYGPAGSTSTGTGSILATLTNPDNGKQLVWHSAGPGTVEVTAVYPDGSFDLHEVYDGLGPLLKDPEGPVLFFNAGHAVVDGTITPLPDGSYEGTITSFTLDGPHPAETGSPEFCDVIQGALL